MPSFGGKRKQVVINLVGPRNELKFYFATELGSFLKRNGSSSLLRNWGPDENFHRLQSLEDFENIFNKFAQTLKEVKNFDFIINQSCYEDIYIQLAAARQVHGMRKDLNKKKIKKIDEMVEQLRILEKEDLTKSPYNTVNINVYLLSMSDTRQFEMEDQDLEICLGGFSADHERSVKIPLNNRSINEKKEDVSMLQLANELKPTFEKIQKLITNESAVFSILAKHWDLNKADLHVGSHVEEDDRDDEFDEKPLVIVEDHEENSDSIFVEEEKKVKLAVF